MFLHTTSAILFFFVVFFFQSVYSTVNRHESVVYACTARLIIISLISFRMVQQEAQMHALIIGTGLQLLTSLVYKLTCFSDRLDYVQENSEVAVDMVLCSNVQ